eukprot:GHVS01106458.1.p1 GENE.GHVS01106458.1~~GHVS01106458.1.p1  ORF type:complete len:105 (-),score=36.05 GHVS01106458.1:172-486(-)
MLLAGVMLAVVNFAVVVVVLMAVVCWELCGDGGNDGGVHSSKEEEELAGWTGKPRARQPARDMAVKGQARRRRKEGVKMLTKVEKCIESELMQFANKNKMCLYD